ALLAADRHRRAPRAHPGGLGGRAQPCRRHGARAGAARGRPRPQAPRRRMSAEPSLAQIGKYPVRRKLGEGATSEVYHCYDPFNDRDVAIKVAFPERFQDPESGRLYKKLFLTEASLAGKLQHPHICEIYDAVAEDKLHYLVMEYVDGGTIEKYCRPEA